MVFHNSPPRIVVQELTFDLTCAKACFQADSPQEYLSELVDQVHNENWDSNPLLLSEAVGILCHKGPDKSNIAVFARVSILNLFTIVTGKCIPYVMQPHDLS